jgi:hypothetical protein
MDLHSLQLQLAQCTGTTKLVRHNLVRSLLLSEGAMLLAEGAAAYWLLDCIAGYQHLPCVAAQPFQSWCLRVNTAARSAVLTMTDGNSTEAIIRQEIDQTDFPLDGMTLWLVADGEHQVLMLPSEY